MSVCSFELYVLTLLMYANLLLNNLKVLVETIQLVSNPAHNLINRISEYKSMIEEMLII